MMANPSIIQKQIKDNTEDLHKFVGDLKLWEEEMKRKDRQLSNEPSDEPLPPVRKPKFSEKPKTFKDEKNEKKRIKSSDYKAWDNFDADKACEDIDNEEENNVKEEMEASAPEEEQYLIEKALYDKELGNKHYKNEKWDEAIDCYSRALTTYPKDPVFFANRALCYLKKKEYSRVEQDCTRSLKLDSTYVKAYMRRATAREALGFFNDARSDLKKVLQLEPNNNQAMRYLARVNATLNKSEMGVKRKANPESGVTRKEPSSTKPVEHKAPSPTPATSTSQELVDDTDVKPKKLEPQWDPCDNIVEPIVKPPHLRSKKPLKTIEIHDVGLNAPKHVCNVKQPETKVLPIPATPEEKSSTPEVVLPVLANPEELSSTLEEVLPVPATPEEQRTTPKLKSIHTLPSAPVEYKCVPPPPKTSVQFHLAWNGIKDNKELCYQFLKQIPGWELPDIFKDSLESKMFSSIVQVLASEFIAAKEPVLTYLRGLSRVRRFSTLALFLSPEDKSCLSSLFDYCSSRGHCTAQELTELKTLYEMS